MEFPISGRPATRLSSQAIPTCPHGEWSKNPHVPEHGATVVRIFDLDSNSDLSHEQVRERWLGRQLAFGRRESSEHRTTWRTDRGHGQRATIW